MQVGDTRWYTAGLIDARKVPGSENPELRLIKGYRMRLSDWSDKEIKEHLDLLAADGITGKVKTSKQNHTDIPAGQPFFQVSEEEPIKKLEQLFKNMGVMLNPDRFAGYEEFFRKNYANNVRRSR